MYSVQQLQALDYLLKRIINEPSYPLFRKNLKFVVEINNSYWCGDFVQLDGPYAYQLFIADDGDVDQDKFSGTGNNAINVLKKIWDAYSKAIKNSHWSNPFKKIDNLPLLFETLIKILKRTDIIIDDSPFFPYLLNAKSITSNTTLPFINLDNEKVKLISLIEIDDSE